MKHYNKLAQYYYKPSMQWTWLSSALFFIAIVLISSCNKKEIEISIQTYNTPINSNLTDILFINDSIAYAIGGDKYTQGLIYQSTNGGNTWAINDSSAKYQFNSIVQMWNNDLYVAGINGKLYFKQTTDTIWHTTQTADANGIWSNITCMQVLDSNVYIFGGISDGMQIIKRNKENNIVSTLPRKVNDVQLFLSGFGFACANGAIYTTKDNATTWQLTTAKGDNFVALHFTNESYGFAVGFMGTILNTRDGGLTWATLRNGNSLTNANFKFRDILFINNEEGYICGEKGLLLKTTNSGQTWKKVSYFTSTSLNKLYKYKNKIWLVGENGNIFSMPL